MPVVEPRSRSDSPWMIRLTLAIAVSNFIIAYFFYSQLGLMGKQLDEMRESDLTTRSQLRARLAVVNYEINHLVDLANLRIKVHFKNIGQTPAMHVGSYGQIGIYEYPLDRTTIAVLNEKLKEDTQSSTIVLEGGQETSVYFDTPHTLDDFLSRLKDENHQLYMIGDLRYLDIYGQNQHYRNFCISYRATELREATATGNSAGTLCNIFNNSD
jgi:hypothetical protein